MAHPLPFEIDEPLEILRRCVRTVDGLVVGRVAVPATSPPEDLIREVVLGDVLGGSERHVLEKMRGTAPARAVVAAANPVERLHGDDRQLAPLEHQHRQAICELDAADVLTPVPLVLSRERAAAVETTKITASLMCTVVMLVEPICRSERGLVPKACLRA